MTDPLTAFEKPADPALPDQSRLPNAPYHQVLAGQPALVTRPNSGIGRAVALGMARAGADVVVNYVTHPETADEVVQEIQAMERKAVALKADVCKEDEVETMFADAIAHFGARHIVVSNAGLQRDSAFIAMTMEQWSTVIGVNLTGQFLCARGRPRVPQAGRCEGGVPARRQAHLHEFGPPADSLGRTRQLCDIQGRHPHDAELRSGIGAALRPG